MGMQARCCFSFLGIAFFLLIGCSGTGSIKNQPLDPNPSYTIGGTVSGLSGSGLMLQNNGGDTLAVNANGSFTFKSPLSAGDAYLVTVSAQPGGPAESCIVTNAVGSVISANVTDVQVACAAVPAMPPAIQTAPNQWTWAGGANAVDQAGVYGSLGVASPGNIPGARTGAVGWTDSAGNLWLFGGAGPSMGGWCGIMDALCAAGTPAYFNDLWMFNGSEWTWVSGSNKTGQAGSYGTEGVASGANAPGGRSNAVSWTDASGSFWLFGGTGYDSAGHFGVLNDLWKFSSGQRTWVGGANTTNQPGQYGSQGTPGTANFPGARANAVAFADGKGNVWLFGGQGCDSTTDCGSALDDLWRFSGGQWTWMNGASVAYPAQAGVYGVQGTGASVNHPGGRYSMSGWLDSSGNLWTFGGIGYNTDTENVAELNDLWKYAAGEWVWMDGNSTLVDQNGVYGTLGTGTATDIPGSRGSGMSWTDASGNLWFFGGEGFGAAGGGTFNDLWVYSGNQWTWMGGSSTGGASGTYGVLGVPAAANIAGARVGAVTWTDAKGNLWLFGGSGFDAHGAAGNLNDLWVYRPQ